MLCDVLRGTLAAIGRTVLFADVAATPTTGVLVQHLRAVGGIQVTASHNPPEYNGIKLFDATGRVVSADFGRKVMAAFEADQPDWVDHKRIARSQFVPPDAVEYHLRLVTSCVDVERIRSRGFHVLLDANHGSGGVLGRRLMERLAGRLTILGDTPDGQFDHPPEPTLENLAVVGGQVIEHGANIGFCQDPDADRLAIIDDQGRYLGEEYTLAICADHVLQSLRGPIVTNCSTSRMVQDIADKYQVPLFHSAVGEANVVDLMLREGAVLGGEGNGGVIDPRVGLVRDSFVAMALILDAMAEQSASVRDLADRLPSYGMEKTKVKIDPQKLAPALIALQNHFRGAAYSEPDGARFDWPGRWLLVRASNTEPIIRIIAEAENAIAAQQICHDAEAVVRSVSSESR
jgi:phosphomannomutase